MKRYQVYGSCDITVTEALQPSPLTRWETLSPVAVGVSERTADLHPEPLVLSSQLNFQQDDHVMFLGSKGHDNNVYDCSFFLFISLANLCIISLSLAIRN